MLRYILNNLAGYLRIRVEGYSPERFLNLCCYHGIFLWNLRPAKGAYEMNIRVRDFRRLRPMVRNGVNQLVQDAIRNQQSQRYDQHSGESPG